MPLRPAVATISSARRSKSASDIATSPRVSRKTTSLSSRWPRPEAQSARRVGRTRPALWRTGSPSASSRALQAVERDGEELVEPRPQLRLAGVRETRAQHRHDLLLRASGNEDDESEAELLLVCVVQRCELTSRRRIGRVALLAP